MNSIPIPVIRRFPAYLRALNEFSCNHILKTTSAALSKHMGSSASQVRQDFSALNGAGQQGAGYDVAELRKALEALAGLGRAVNAVMVGTEAAGLALLKSGISGGMNVSIREIFSEGACTPEEEYQTLHFQAIDAFPAFIRSAQPDLVIINTADTLARWVMDLAVNNGVPAVWNLTEKDLLETENTLVENLGWSDSILFLNAKRIALENGSKIPKNVLKRMPIYLRKLQELIDLGTRSVTSSELGQQLGTTPSQVRQDLNFLGPSGRQGLGYDIPELCRKIGALLGLDEVASCAQIGQGIWSRTFADPLLLTCCGLDLTAVFEKSADAQQELSCGEADLAIIEAPDRGQIISADALNERGIKAVWNLSDFDLVEGADCELVENFHLEDNLFILLSRDYLRRDDEKKEVMQAARKLPEAPAEIPQGVPEAAEPAPRPAPAPKSPALPVPDSGDGPYAFLSYSHRNTEKAMEIIRMLQENGYRIWFDDEIEGGTGWRDSLATKIEGCSVFVLLMSEEYQKSKYCKRELYFADTNDKPMLQISIDGTPLSSEFKFILGGIQAIRLSSSPDHKFLEKLRKIEALHAIKAR